MTKDEIILTMIQFLDQHYEGKLRGSMHQEPYKGDLFKLFVEAYNNGYIHDSSQPLTAGALPDTIVPKWFTSDEKANAKRTELLTTLSSFWSEWQYAWDHHQ
jgi:hypothetical protein